MGVMGNSQSLYFEMRMIDIKMAVVSGAHQRVALTKWCHSLTIMYLNLCTLYSIVIS